MILNLLRLLYPYLFYYGFQQLNGLGGQENEGGNPILYTSLAGISRNPGERMTEALGANSVSSRVCWREEGCKGRVRSCASTLGQGPEPEELLYLGPETWGHELQSQHAIFQLKRQRADFLVIDLWYLSWSKLSFLSITVMNFIAHLLAFQKAHQRTSQAMTQLLTMVTSGLNPATSHYGRFT